MSNLCCPAVYGMRLSAGVWEVYQWPHVKKQKQSPAILPPPAAPDRLSKDGACRAPLPPRSELWLVCFHSGLALSPSVAGSSGDLKPCQRQRFSQHPPSSGFPFFQMSLSLGGWWLRICPIQGRTLSIFSSALWLLMHFSFPWPKWLLWPRLRTVQVTSINVNIWKANEQHLIT